MLRNALSVIRGRRSALLAVWCRRLTLKRMLRVAVIVTCLLVSGATFIFYGVQQPSAFFPVKTIITVPEGATVTEVAHLLDRTQVIRSAFSFRLLARLSRESITVHAGDYYFDQPLSLTEVVSRVTRGVYGLEPIRVTIPEGATTYQMASVLAKSLPEFDETTFLLITRDKEGYLYPDTYLFPPNATVTQVVEVLERTFYEKLRSIEPLIAESGRPVHEIVTMASLLEKEARDYDERRLIAGILWRRIEIDMPLQVDAVFGFIQRRETFNPRFSDLEVESPYNTYKYRGLPPGPIGNPSLVSLKAAIQPEPTDALFYLHGRDGIMRVAVDYYGHLVNRRRYLD